LKKLNYLWIHHCKNLGGVLPTSLGSLTDLEHVRISATNVYGEIPEELGYLPLLQNLTLSENKLTGEIPSSFSDLSNLVNFKVAYNDLTGKIPLLSSTLTTCDLKLNTFTCHQLNNTACSGNNMLGILFDH